MINCKKNNPKGRLPQTVSNLIFYFLCVDVIRLIFTHTDNISESFIDLEREVDVLKSWLCGKKSGFRSHIVSMYKNIKKSFLSHQH